MGEQSNTAGFGEAISDNMGELIFQKLSIIDNDIIEVKSSLKTLHDYNIPTRITKLEVDISQVKAMRLALYTFSISILMVLGILKTSIGVEILTRLIGLK